MKSCVTSYSDTYMHSFMRGRPCKCCLDPNFPIFMCFEVEQSRSCVDFRIVCIILNVSNREIVRRARKHCHILVFFRTFFRDNLVECKTCKSLSRLWQLLASASQRFSTCTYIRVNITSIPKWLYLYTQNTAELNCIVCRLRINLV